MGYNTLTRWFSILDHERLSGWRIADSYDRRRERCFVDQTSSLAVPMHLILGSPVDLQRDYAENHPDVGEFIAALNELYDAVEQSAGRERLAGRADELKKKYAGLHMTELSYLLGYAADYLRGDYPLRRIEPLPTLNELP